MYYKYIDKYIGYVLVLYMYWLWVSFTNHSSYEQFVLKSHLCSFKIFHSLMFSYLMCSKIYTHIRTLKPLCKIIGSCIFSNSAVNSFKWHFNTFKKILLKWLVKEAHCYGFSYWSCVSWRWARRSSRRSCTDRSLLSPSVSPGAHCSPGSGFHGDQGSWRPKGTMVLIMILGQYEVITSSPLSRALLVITHTTLIRIWHIP